MWGRGSCGGESGRGSGSPVQRSLIQLLHVLRYFTGVQSINRSNRLGMLPWRNLPWCECIYTYKCAWLLLLLLLFRLLIGDSPSDQGEACTTLCSAVFLHGATGTCAVFRLSRATTNGSPSTNFYSVAACGTRKAKSPSTWQKNRCGRSQVPQVKSGQAPPLSCCSTTYCCVGLRSAV